MNCPTCGKLVPDDATFCPSCGNDPRKPPISSLPTVSGLETIAPMREIRRDVLESGSRFANRYEVIRMIGQGGMGVVYLARDTSTGEDVVLKLVHPELVTGEEAVKRLMAEGLLARQMRHPNIVAVYDVAQYEGQPYFTMEYVQGGTMRTWMVNGMSSGREVPLDIAVNLTREILAGLGEAHRMGVVHRDLKPENVLFVGNPDSGNLDIKILDFGIAKAVGKKIGSHSGPVGTPPYMAPEQLTAAETVGPAADLYSLSVMLYELLMDTAPQARWEPVSTSRRDVPKAMDAFLEKGLAGRPKSRFQSVAEYSAGLSSALGGGTPVRPLIDDPQPSPAPVPQPPPAPVPPPTRKPWWQYQGLFAGTSRKTKIWVNVVAVLIIIGVIGALVDNGERPGLPLPPDVLPDSSTFPLQPQSPATPSVAGYWVDGYGNRFNASQNGAQFNATGFVPGIGQVSVRGTLTAQIGETITITIVTSNYTLPGTAQLYLDNVGMYHMKYQLADGSNGDFHINHSN